MFFHQSTQKANRVAIQVCFMNVRWYFSYQCHGFNLQALNLSQCLTSMLECTQENKIINEEEEGATYNRAVINTATKAGTNWFISDYNKYKIITPNVLH